MTETVPTRTVKIPGKDEHWGRSFNMVEVTLKWVCPTCGGPRGETIHHDMRTYDGRHWTYCDGWSNPCGHVDYYSDVRKEVANQKREAQAEAETIFAAATSGNPVTSLTPLNSTPTSPLTPGTGNGYRA